MLSPVPVAYKPLFKPARYKTFYGGRGSAKSWSIARILVGLAARKKLRIVCAREYQVSIADSVHKLLVDQIDALGLRKFYHVTDTGIYCTHTGSSFRFIGLKTNINNLKGLEGADICWVEEAESVSAKSWNVLIPTIRKKGSEIWVSFNPDQETDPTFQRMVKHPPKNAIICPVSWRDNPFFTQELRDEMEHLREVDLDAYNWVWEGQFRVSSDAQILHGKWTIGEIAVTPEADGPYFGSDFGYASDPTTLIKCWIIGASDRKQGTLYIERDFGKLQLDISDTATAYRSIRGAEKYLIRADSARPETIAHIAKDGINIIGVDKWPGSVEDGIAVLRSFDKIVIHPDCKGTIQEARLYSYKVDKLTGNVLPDIVDKHNHYIDALRYALAPIIKRTRAGQGMLDYMAQRKLAREAAAQKEETE